MKKNLQTEIFEILKNESSPKYAEFTASLLPDGTRVLGVPIPRLRAFSKNLIADNRWEEFLEFEPLGIHEENLMRAIIAGSAPVDYPSREALVLRILEEVGDWGVCDTFAASVKPKDCDRPTYFKFLCKLASSEKPYFRRFALAAMTLKFLDTDEMFTALQIACRMKDERRDVLMARAWCCSMCYARDPDAAFSEMSKYKQELSMMRLAVRKIRESRQISDKDKLRARELLPPSVRR